MEWHFPLRQHKQQEQERERLAKSSGKCHSIASPESGIEDGWCIDTCSQGSCSAEFCSLGCRALAPGAKDLAPALQQQQQQQQQGRQQQGRQQQEEQANAIAAQGDDECFTIAPPESHIDDEWCANSCVRNYCPEDLCSKGCQAMQIATDSAAQGQEGGAALGVQSGGSHQEDEGQCRSVVGIEKGIDDEWCKTSCLQGICPDEFCSKSCLLLKFDASAAGTRAAEKRRLLRRGFLAPNARQVGDTLPSAAASPSSAASPSPAASPLPSPSPSPGPPVSLTRHETFAEATARETADDIEEARRRGEKRE